MGQNKKTTKIKKMYYIRFLFRILFFIATVITYLYFPQTVDVMIGINMFKTFNIMHVFLLIWLTEIILQFIPMREQFSIGSLKHFGRYMQKTTIKDELMYLKTMVQRQIKANTGAFKVLFLWIFLVVAVGILKAFHILTHREMFLLAAFLYVCDLICVLFFCPFQKFFMHNKCCATCRIFNWDHLMMFSPLIFVTGVYTALIVLLSLASLLIWEFRYYAHPERFFEESNETLKCKNCKEKLCRKYK